ncbi:acetylornithine deacetylase [Agrilactobacillus composti DSM 18527 = JCM 14202]|uniref:M20/M25/M40 family metallo-hydrolase n=1 Tax=Agrilactobacillus composti TaxID=398555 RepID=UPI00042DEF3C|nr:M20/M25/M40 family metallo-hydrolase [Agrilactobacillus composti]GAF41638.1 acetylornithine deacetylase [Agrilactobacillus composti DSM 18527 = JCM 14202]
MEENRKLLILKDLVAIKTENNNEIMVARYLKQLCDLAGIFNEILPINDDRANFVAEIGDGQPVVVLSGHMDTVIADPKSWQTDPFELTPKGDRLYGRGATDMKSGLAALVIAMIELKEANVQINGTIRLLLLPVKKWDNRVLRS